MKKESTGLLSMQKPGADERSPTQLGKDIDSVAESQLFFSGDSFRDSHNSNAKPKANNSYQGMLSSEDDNVFGFFDFLIGDDNLNYTAKIKNKDSERKISFRQDFFAIKKISKRA